ncbi:hypothetical protein [Saccharolobus caldissimus]|uniref:Uncharacterized protein n=1 Tax=Saccharolobus caldissimus TaxID=1702097 RepID=A0AAQ4CPK8_9CREN|nr:hypothetical protein [Saccharolobus caldissimus]BDB97739.1 hypothetical protein SACC_07560 [Saccharolobus caldissimus]
MQKRNICPYYKNGFCTSPALDKPTDAVVSTSRCFGQFKTCRYFLDNEDSKVGLEMYNEDKTIEQEIRFYPKINVLESPIDSGCENYQLIKSEKGLIAYCKVLKRVLITQQATLCNKEFLKCPFRNLLGS